MVTGDGTSTARIGVMMNPKVIPIPSSARRSARPTTELPSQLLCVMASLREWETQSHTRQIPPLSGPMELVQAHKDRGLDGLS